MNNSIISYLISSAFLIKNRPWPFLLLSTASVFLVVPLAHETLQWSYGLFAGVLFFFINIATLGQYSEITMRNQTIPYADILKRHGLNFFIVNAALASPLVITVSLQMFFEIDPGNWQMINHIFISCVSVYILPLLFILGKKWESIVLGFKCVAGNLSFHLPIFIIIIASYVLDMAVDALQNDLSQNVYAILSVSVSIFLIFIEFVIFISATLILKEKVFPQNDV